MTPPVDDTPYEVQPLTDPPDATVRVPGSKSLTNRALLAAALAEGTSLVLGALDADDTEAMTSCLQALGTAFQREGDRTMVAGTGRPAPGPVALDARQSGTTARFLLPLLALGRGDYLLDGSEQLRARPMGPAVDALRAFGVLVDERGAPGHLPLAVTAAGLPGGRVRVDTETSSQFLSGLLLAAPRAEAAVTLELGGEVVSRPYLDLTIAVMRAFGARVESGEGTYVVEPTGYQPARYEIEPDASSAGYFFAAAAITGGRVQVPGLGTRSAQGDVALVDVLEQMGAQVERDDDAITVTGTGTLHGVDVDLVDLPDMALTVAAVAVFADSPTTVRGVGVIRGHETDRIDAVVAELARCGVRAEATDDSFVVHPSPPQPATVDTYDDHRMAMAFSLLGLRAPGIRIAQPGCVAKTFPGFWDALESLRDR